MSSTPNNLTLYINRAIASNPIEAAMLARLYKAAEDAGDPIVSVDDGGENVEVTTIREVYDNVFNLDESRLYTERGRMVYIVMGNEPYELFCDYSSSLEDIINPISEWAETQAP